MTEGKIGTKDLSFNMIVQTIRRKYMMDAILSDDKDEKDYGMRILKNVSGQLQHYKERKSEEEEENGLNDA